MSFSTGSRGLAGCHVVAKLTFDVFNRNTGISTSRASPEKGAGPVSGNYNRAAHHSERDRPQFSQGESSVGSIA